MIFLIYHVRWNSIIKALKFSVDNLHADVYTFACAPHTTKQQHERYKKPFLFSQ